MMQNTCPRHASISNKNDGFYGARRCNRGKSSSSAEYVAAVPVACADDPVTGAPTLALGFTCRGPPAADATGLLAPDPVLDPPTAADPGRPPPPRPPPRPPTGVRAMAGADADAVAGTVVVVVVVVVVAPTRPRPAISGVVVFAPTVEEPDDDEKVDDDAAAEREEWLPCPFTRSCSGSSVRDNEPSTAAAWVAAPTTPVGPIADADDADDDAEDGSDVERCEMMAPLGERDSDSAVVVLGAEVVCEGIDARHRRKNKQKRFSQRES
jgi:hypothetical protein